METQALIARSSLLLVDDAAGFRLNAQKMLEAIGFAHVRGVGSLAEATRLLDGKPKSFDLVLMDIHLPDGDGTEACATLSSKAHACDIPIVIVTGDNSPEMIGKAFAAGGSEFIVKPFNNAVLRARLGSVLRQHHLLAQTRRQEQHIAHLFDVFSDGLIEIGENWRVVRTNRRARVLLDAHADHLHDAPFDRQLLAGRCSPETLARFRKALCDTGFAACELTGFDHAEAVHHIAMTASKVTAADGDCGALIALRDITQQKEERLHLRRLALHDPLTGLPNRLLLADRLDQSIQHAKRERSFIAVIFLDLNGFKALNDDHGHEFGDNALKIFATRLRDAVRSSDTVARLGGDEFVAVLDGFRGAEEIPHQAARLRQAVDGPIELPAGQWSLSAGCGVAVYPLDGEIPSDLLRTADHRMYADKRRQRHKPQAGSSRRSTCR